MQKTKYQTKDCCQFCHGMLAIKQLPEQLKKYQQSILVSSLVSGPTQCINQSLVMQPTLGILVSWEIRLNFLFTCHLKRRQMFSAL